MDVSNWRSEKRSEPIEIPDGPPDHLVQELLDTIDLMDSRYPTTEHVAAVKRVATAVREEIES